MSLEHGRQRQRRHGGIRERSGLCENLRVLRWPEVHYRVGYSRMHIGRLEKAGTFPPRIRLGANAVGWLEHEIDAWIKARAAERDGRSEDGEDDETDEDKPQ